MLEHPKDSKAWDLDEVRDLFRIPGVMRAEFNMCQYGMTSADEFGTGYVFKGTAVMSNSVAICSKLSKRHFRSNWRNLSDSLLRRKKN